VVGPEIIARLRAGFGDIIDLYQALIEENAVITAHLPSKFAWWDGGTLDSYLELHRDLLAGRPEGPFHLDPGARVAPDVTMSGFVSICAGVRVEAGARIENSILWPNAVVAPGVSVKNSVVADGCTATSDLTGTAWTSRPAPWRCKT
jgi:NDP-sugar pyrophosphorylase family protein